jgi:aryl-alcohol dehydrogenase-like predicted oxidoreductase
LPLAHQQGLGVIAKRPLGNAPWRFVQQPLGHYGETYWQRMHALAYDTAGLPWDELALRFCAWQAPVSSAIVGTSNLVHLQHNVALVEKGPLPVAQVSAIHERFRALGAEWGGEI